MDAYEATKMVFSRIQALDPDNAATVMGVLLIQDPGEQEMIRLAFGPDSLLRAVVNESMNKHQNQQQQQPPPPPSPPLAPPPFFSDFDDDALLCGGLHNAVVGPRGGPMMAAAPGPDHAGGRCLFFSRGYCRNGPACRFFHHHHHHHAACVPPPSMQTAGGAGGGNANYNEAAAAAAAAASEDSDYYYPNATQLSPHPHHHSNASPATLLGSPRLIPTTATSTPHLPIPPSSFTAASPKSSSLTTLNHLLRLQHLHHRRLLQRAEDDEAAANAAATLRLLNMRAAAGHYPSSSPPSSPDIMMLSPASRQIYLTFPADSTFTEEDVSNYFAIYGPVQDVRIPYQQKRMFGFVSFVYPETVRMVLAKGNPHFVCDSRVLVKPYKEKPKLRDTNRKQLMTMISERSDFSTAAMENDSAYGFHPLEGPRMMLNGTQEAAAVLLRRKMIEEDHHQQAAAAAAANVTMLHQAIELQRKRFSGLHMLDLNNHHNDVSSPVPMQPVSSSSLSESTVIDPPAVGTTAFSSGVTNPASAAAAATPDHHPQPCNGTDHGKCLLRGSDGFASDPHLTTEETRDMEYNDADVADIAKGTPETNSAAEDTKFSSNPTRSEADAHVGISALPRIPVEGSDPQQSSLTESSEQYPPERPLPSPAKNSLVHSPPCTTSEELEFPNPISPAPWLISSPASRCQAGRGAVGI